MRYSGSGDPARSLQLLWEGHQPPKRGPKPRLTAAQITHTALQLADAQGLEALSMRRVADQLEIATMSLYTYVPGKAELIDLMLDAAYAQTAKPDEVVGGWRGKLELIARENWKLYLRHPWMLQIVTVRPVLGPNETAKYDYELRAIDGIGLTDLEMDSVLTLINDYAQSAARGAVAAREAQQRTGVTDEQWWQAHAPLLSKVFDTSRYPLAVRVGTAVGAAYGAAYHPEKAFEFGLQRVLDGVEAFIRSRANSAETPS